MMNQFEGERTSFTTAQAIVRSGLTRSYLTYLLRTGKLEGFRYPHTREWFIYVDSLEMFLAAPRKSGPKGPRLPKQKT